METKTILARLDKIESALNIKNPVRIFVATRPGFCRLDDGPEIAEAEIPEGPGLNIFVTGNPNEIL